MMTIGRIFRLLPLALLAFATGCSNPVEDDDHGHADDVVGVRISTADGTRIASYAAGEWNFTSGAAIRLTVGADAAWRIDLVDIGGGIVDLHDHGGEHTLEIVSDDEAVLTVAEADHGIIVSAIAEGSTEVIFRLMHGSHADFETNPGVPVIVEAP